MTDPTPTRRPGDKRPPIRPAVWRRLTGWLLILAGSGMVLSGLTAVLHH